MARKTYPEEDVIVQLKRAAEEVAKLPNELPGKRADKVRAEIGNVLTELGRVVTELDPVRIPSTVFDPADPGLVGKFIGLGLIAQKKVPLGEVEPFYGSGVYALYYDGPFPLYRPLSGTEHPIYVGKADPASNDAKTPQEQEQRLHRRLMDHLRAISMAEKDSLSTLAIEDFKCRFLVVQSGWQTPAEDYLIHLFKPIWNKEIKILYGIGKHGDKSKTRANLRSPWDVLHPGRKWAHEDPTIANAKDPGQIEQELEAHFAEQRVYRDIESILHKFFEDLRQE